MKITVQNRRILHLIAICLVGTHIQLSSRIKKVITRVEQLETLITSQTTKLEKIKAIKVNPLLDPAIVKAVIQVESRGNEKAYNTATGAVGLMQLTPIIYKKLCGLTKKDAFIAKNNIACGSLFLNSLLTKYGGNLERALMFYNSGHRNVENRYNEKVIDIYETEKN